MSFLGCTDGNTGVCVTGQGQGFDAWFGLGASLVSVKPLDYTGALAAAKRLGLSFKAARTHLRRGLRLLVGLHGHRLLRFKCAGPRRPRAAPEAPLQAHGPDPALGIGVQPGTYPCAS